MKEDASSPISWPLVRRVRIKNYKSIGHCDVELAPFTVLVGRNGAGKSNFLDALRFVADAVDTSLEQAIRSRGGIDQVRRRSQGHPHNFSVNLELKLDHFETAYYAFEIAARKGGSFILKEERLKIENKSGRVVANFARREGQITSSVEHMPPVAEDRLYLVNAAGLPEFRPAFDALSSMGFYNLNPEAIRELQSPDAGELLRRDGGNLASVMARLTPEVAQRICDYLASVVPGITGVAREDLGPKETLLFRQEIQGAEHPWHFFASDMSDGTLRVLGVLTAVMQLVGADNPVRFVGIEEPGTALHPAATGALMDALREAIAHTQIAITTHNPELLDQIEPNGEKLLVVVAEGGNTKIAPVDVVGREALREHLYSAGELLRMDQLHPDPIHLVHQEEQMKLSFFDGDPTP